MTPLSNTVNICFNSTIGILKSVGLGHETSPQSNQFLLNCCNGLRNMKVGVTLGCAFTPPKALNHNGQSP
jgi:hypothetical protein